MTPLNDAPWPGPVALDQPPAYLTATEQPAEHLRNALQILYTRGRDNGLRLIMEYEYIDIVALGDRLKRAIQQLEAPSHPEGVSP